jgi:hypothetical protein
MSEPNDHFLSAIQSTFTKTSNFSDMQQPMTSADAAQKLYEHTGMECELFDLITAFKSLGFESENVDGQLFWLLL